MCYAGALLARRIERRAPTHLVSADLQLHR
jgi:hypothetical protein